MFKVFYIIFILIIFFFKEIEKNRINKNLLLSFSIIFFVSAFRYDVGWDYNMYYWYYKDYIPLNNIDLLFKEIIYLARKINYPQMVYMMYSFITILNVWLVLKNKKYNTLGLFTFVCIPFFYLASFSIIRQLAAVTLVYYLFSKCLSSKIKFLIGITLAYMLHFTSLISIFMLVLHIFLKKIARSKIYKLNIFLVVSQLLLYLYSDKFIKYLSKIFIFLPSKFLYKLEFYTNITEKSGGTKILYLMIIISFLLIINLKKIKDKKLLIEITFFNFGVFLWVFLYSFSDFGYRLSLYFTIFLVSISIKIPYFLKKIVKFKKVVEVFGIIIFLLYLLNTHMGYLSGKNRKSQYFPYKIYLFEDYSDLK